MAIFTLKIIIILVLLIIAIFVLALGKKQEVAFPTKGEVDLEILPGTSPEEIFDILDEKFNQQEEQIFNEIEQAIK
ncbi:MAG: hypothetical protein QXU40_04360 [Candidatus Pacearchaeota archaeon]